MRVFEAGQRGVSLRRVAGKPMHAGRHIPVRAGPRRRGPGIRGEAFRSATSYLLSRLWNQPVVVDGRLADNLDMLLAHMK